MTATALHVVLVQPDAWRPDGGRNLETVRRCLDHAPALGEQHIVVLPELVGATMPTDRYAHEIAGLARACGAWVIGGSHHAAGAPVVNGGVVADPNGTIVDHYEKRNPYGVEHDHGVAAGQRAATLTIAGRRVTVLLCADAWFAELLLAAGDPELIVVPSFTITRRPPAFARALWEHLAVARAYEFGAYVALGDWRPPATYHEQPAAGVSGVADPFPTAPAGFFTPATPAPVSVHALDLDRLDRHRADRRARRFIRPTSTDGVDATAHRSSLTPHVHPDLGCSRN